MSACAAVAEMRSTAASIIDAKRNMDWLSTVIVEARTRGLINTLRAAEHELKDESRTFHALASMVGADGHSAQDIQRIAREVYAEGDAL